MTLGLHLMPLYIYELVYEGKSSSQRDALNIARNT